MKYIGIGFLLLVPFHCLFGCAKRVDLECYRKTLGWGVSKFSMAKKMEEWYGIDNVDHFITYFGREKTLPRTWTTVAYAFGRYRISVKFPVAVDYTSCTVVRTGGAARIYIHEIENIEITESGRVAARIGEQAIYEEEVWDSWEEADGDVSVFDMEIKRDSPLSNFKRYRASWGKDRVRPLRAGSQDGKGKGQKGVSPRIHDSG